MATLHEARELAESRGARRLDLKVTDLLGRWQHFELPIERLTAEGIEGGIGVDGSDLRGFQPVHEADVVLVPDLTTATVDPVPSRATLSVLCNVVDPRTHKRHTRDPRHVAQKAEAYLRTTGLADHAALSAELDFYVFDDVRYQQSGNTGFYFVDSVEAEWNSGRDEGPNLGYKVPSRQGYGVMPPADSLAELRWAVVEALHAIGASVEAERHESATAAQCSLALARSGLVRKADETQWSKHLVRNVSRAYGKVATFMPKPLHGERGSALRVHQSLWRGETPLFFDSNGYAGLSQNARHYIGGLLRHAKAVMAFTNPTTNSYRRFVPGLEAPTHLVYAARNRSAAVRIPGDSDAPAEKRLEFRVPDASANPYLAFAAMVMAGLDGIQNRIDPGDPLERNVYELSAGDAGRLAHVPRSLREALDGLEADQGFLKKGDVFTQDVVDAWLEIKRAELREVESRPTPFEYELYFSG